MLADENGGRAGAPIELLSLLPPPPAAGWPQEFVMQQVAATLRESSATVATLQSMAGAQLATEKHALCNALYPARRRAQRLSFVLWATFSQDDDELLAALETTSTSDRLRLGIARLRQLRELLQGR